MTTPSPGNPPAVPRVGPGTEAGRAVAARPRIRDACSGDAEAIAAIYAPFCEATAVSFETTAPGPAEIARRIRATSPIHPWLVLDDGGVSAYAYAAPHRARAAYAWGSDVTVYVEPALRRRGAGRALYASLFESLRLLGYVKAFAGVALPNPASVALHESAGFDRVGIFRGVGYKLGAWRDVAWFQASLQPERSDPEPPANAGVWRGSPAWLAAISAGLSHYRGRG